MSANGWTLVLGGTRGLGAEIGRLGRERGWRTIEVGRSTPTEVRSDRWRLRCDLASSRDVTSLLAVLDTERIDVDRFFWVAGAMMQGRFADQAPNDVVRLVDVNLRNPLVVAQRLWRRLQCREGGGSFTVLASTAAIAARPLEAVYAATKAAQAAFARGLAAENAHGGVRVSLFLPGGMKTGLWSDGAPQEFGSFLEPSAVAAFIVSRVERQRQPFLELEIPRGSL